MILLSFHHQEYSALIMTDTLATTRGGEPLIFQSKAWAVPHINMAIANTGVGNFGGRWNEYLRSSLLATDIEMVKEFAPEALRLTWSQVISEYEIDEVPTTTMYHFGYPTDSDRLVRYVYRSAEDFESERHEEPGFAINPWPEGDFEVPVDDDSWVALAQRVRAEQNVRPAEDRIYIGGELYLLILGNWQSQTIRLHRFDDYEQAWLDMNDRSQREPGAA
ncbi:hypothetical protein [Isoptericola croceus]|uniref:hypothetical protein n=1 Tax=Isoptericola croceus TaxID=3031406 RepID=UPI0023FA4900|nr:hypothetical protein [Isoptericola croceus]